MSRVPTDAFRAVLELNSAPEPVGLSAGNELYNRTCGFWVRGQRAGSRGVATRTNFAKNSFKSAIIEGDWLRGNFSQIPSKTIISCKSAKNNNKLQVYKTIPMQITTKKLPGKANCKGGLVFIVRFRPPSIINL